MQKGNISLTIDPSQIIKLSKQGGDLIFDPKAEDSIIQLLWLQKQIAEALEVVKNAVELTGLAYNPNFTSVTGDQIKMTYQYSGASYGYRPADIKRFKAPFFESRTVRAINSKAVEKYEQANKGRLPVGIFRRERERKVVIRVGKVVE